jgi:dienelactone hydrolase
MLQRAALVAVTLCIAGATALAQYRAHTDRFAPPSYATPEAWRPRAEYLRAHVLASAGLLPMPEKTPLNPVIFGELVRQDYRVSKVYFESLPGFYVTGNLYRPLGDGPFPAVLTPHGHWAYGRFENTPVNSVPGRAISLARQGFVVFTYDAIGYNDSRQLPHTFGGSRESLWGLSLGGLQLWNSIRAVDFLESLPYVRRDAIGATGESGGGTQTFLLAASDERIAVAAPVNMISLHMQGGCLCENLPGLRLDTTNVEIAATIAPRPLLMISATGDWTKDTMEAEYPAVRRIYGLHGAESRVHAVRFEAEHNYNRDSREAMYAWMARWLQHAPADVKRPERSFQPDPLPDLLVFHGRALPSNAVTEAQLTTNWIAAARRQVAAGPQEMLASALRHAVGFAWEDPIAAADTRPTDTRVVLLANDDPVLRRALQKRGFGVQSIPVTPFDAAASGKVRHFETYNRTAASQRVADIVMAARKHPGAALIAEGNDALAGLLAISLAPIARAVLDVGDFDTTDDEAFVQRVYISGLRRAGDFRTSVSMTTAKLVIHGAGPRFHLPGVDVQSRRLPLDEIVKRLER